MKQELNEYVNRAGQKPMVECEREDCVIIDRGSSTTLLAWMPAFDKYGNPLNKDLNTRTTDYYCRTCGKEWTVKS